MKKTLLLVIGLISGVASVSAQDILIMRPDNKHIVNDSTITVNGTTAINQYIMGLDIINNGIGSITVDCKWEDVSTIPGTWQQMCWGLCYSPQQATEWTAPKSQTIAIHDTNNTFAGYLDDTNQTGCESVRYVFYNTINSADSSWVIIKFCIMPTAVQQISANNLHISAPYPNPSSAGVTFNYHINSSARLDIFNTIGQSVRTLTLSPSDSKLNLNVSSMPAGIYICKLEADGATPVYQKMIVSH
jgi:hypothetical protein